ncbi:MAG TPA: glycosyltransferase family 2 protein [Lachnospiraceae bacterium]|nr:glycosyltransferase family 2 protein [Lachnospiraceae bacterium]HPF29305.1 glycosyltransferase family 2 protein [Lachnospiraceae bacterium]
MISVSVCMIVKNEEAVLKRCLDSLQGIYEELIIVDTGSTDRTKEIAAQYTDKVFDYIWRDDFAAARNFAFSKATMDYIYSADADEVMDEENSKRFLILKEALLTEIEIVQMWYLNRQAFVTTENYDREYRPKLYKRVRTFLWQDAIHEAVNLTPVVYDSDVEICHMPENEHEKRDFSIFIKMEERGEFLSERLHHMYAKELFLSGDDGDFAKSASYFQKSLYDERRSASDRTDSYCILARNARITGNHNDFFKWCLKNISVSPCSEICNELGYFYYAAGDYEEASIWFINASEETEAVLCANSKELIPAEMLYQCYRKMAEVNPLIREECLREAERYLCQAEELKKKRLSADTQ